MGELSGPDRLWEEKSFLRCIIGGSSAPPLDVKENGDENRKPLPTREGPRVPPLIGCHSACGTVQVPTAASASATVSWHSASAASPPAQNSPPPVQDSGT